MAQEPEFTELIHSICTRPRMFVWGGTYDEVTAYITGYAIGKQDSPISGEKWHVLNRYACLKYSFPTNYGWGYVLKNCANDEHHGIELIEKTILEFVELQNTMSDENILDYAKSNVKHVPEGEAERVFRKFDRALLQGKEEIIKPLIEEHPDAQILWQRSYPSDIVALLDDLTDDQPLKRIFASSDGNKVRIITSDWPFPIELNFKDDRWKVNASDIIKMRMHTNSSKKDSA